MGREATDLEMWAVEAESNGFLDRLNERRNQLICKLIKKESEEVRGAIKEVDRTISMFGEVKSGK